MTVFVCHCLLCNESRVEETSSWPYTIDQTLVAQEQCPQCQQLGCQHLINHNFSCNQIIQTGDI